jgi:hypothetical protein
MAQPLAGQVDPDQGKYPVDYDTNYIEDFRHRLNLSFVTEVKANGIGIITPENKVLLYLTNIPIPNYGFMFSYRWLNLQLTLPIPALSTPLADKGETTNYSLGLGLTTRKWYVRNFFEYFQGYYISNPEVVFPDIPADSTIVLDDLRSRTYYLTGYYMINGNRYSHRSLLWQSEVQKKSAGSLFTGGNFGLRSIDASQDILPDPIEVDVNEARYLFAGINLGYAYTLVLGKHFNISLALIPGASYTWAAYTTLDQQENVFSNGYVLNMEGRFQMLFQKGNFYAGANYTGYLITDFLKTEYPIGSSHNYIRVNLGYRFKLKPIKFLKPLGLSN